MFTKIKRSVLWNSVSLTVLVALFAGMLSIPVAAAPRAAPTGSRLRALAGNFLVGYASRNDFWNMSDSVQYQDVARTEFNFMTPENAMKWDATEPSQGNFTFSQADQHVAFAKANNMVIHGHTLVWHSQLPGWVGGISGSANLTNVMYNHIDTVMNHWQDGEIAVWDVVNEAFNEDGSRRSSPFQNTIGNSYIELAFQRARAADPQAKLIYNDYNVETVNSKSTAMYNMVTDFKNRGIPIDGVGLQMHLTGTFTDYNSLAANMARFAALGVDIYITEMDVRFQTPLDATELQTQATIYSNVLDKCMLQPRCKGFQVWGIPDKYSWVPEVFGGEGGALIFDDNYGAKPAYYSIQSRLGGAPAGSTQTPTPVGTLQTHVETESMTRTGGNSINSPFTGVTLYSNGNNVSTTYNFPSAGSYRIDVSGASSNTTTASVDVYIGGVNRGRLGWAGTSVSTQSLWFTLSAGGSQQIRLQLDNDVGQNDTNLDWFELRSSTGGAGPTATRTLTGSTATPTRTTTIGGPTITRTRTPTAGGPTATRTRTPTPSGPTATPSHTPITGGGALVHIETENMTRSGGNSLSNPFVGVVFYNSGNNVKTNYAFPSGPHTIKVRGASSNSLSAQFDVYVNGVKIGSTLSHTGTSPTTVTSASFTVSMTSSVVIELRCINDIGQWDNYLDWLEVY